MGTILLEMVPPIIIENRLDGFEFYESPTAVTHQLEEWYVTDEDWRAYDGEGREVVLQVEDGRVIARLSDGAPYHTEDLRAALLSWLQRRGQQPRKALEA